MSFLAALELLGIWSALVLGVLTGVTYGQFKNRQR